MATICTVLGCSHSPFLFMPPELWDEVRRRRQLAKDVPRPSVEANKVEFDRCMKAYATLRQKIEAVKPDVLLIFGDDQREQFSFSNFPALGIYLGEEMEGESKPVGFLRRAMGMDNVPFEENWVKAKGAPEFGKQLMMGLMKRDFDLAFSLDLPNKERGLGHAFLHPPYYLTPNYDIPILPFFVNCCYAPQPSGKRCYDLGKAVKQVIEESPMDLRVAVIGSGGLWHTPGVPGAYLDEEFDRTILKFVGTGEARKMAEYFDSCEWPYPSATPEVADKLLGGTGMSAGLGSGVGETRNWLIASAVADGVNGSVVDYVPVYASPCGMAFAHWDMN